MEDYKENEDDKLREQVVYAINQLHVCECTKDKLIAWVKKQHEEKLLNNDKYQTVSVEILDRLYESEKELERLKQGEQKPETIFLKFRIGDKVTNGEDTYTIDFIGKDRYWVKEHDCITIPFEYQHHWELVGQKPTDKVEPKFKVGDKIKLAKEPKYPAREIIAIKNDAYYFDMLVHLPFSHQDEWELVEKKSANKVEPKFKVGDWIANGKFTWYIKEFKNNLYRLISSDGTEVCDTISFVKRNFHHWTIKDAKDGDVLSFNDGHGNDCIELIKSITDWNKDKKIEFWFCLTNNEIYEVFDGICPYTNMTSRQNAAPATKEQRDLLFQKMKEAGFEWDADKKVLKKIGQEQTKLPNGKDYGIDSLYHAARILEKTLGDVEGYQSDDGILEHKCAIEAVNRLYKQNTTPKFKVGDCIYDKKDSYNRNVIREVGKDYYINAFAQKMDMAYTNANFELLKHLEDNHIDSKPAAWSEEDEKIKSEIEVILANIDRSKFTLNYTFSDMIFWLKSLKEKSAWKPSDEQMEIIHKYAEQNNYDGSVLTSLYRDLKKLKGE